MNPEFKRVLPDANTQWKLNVNADYQSAPTTLIQDAKTVTTPVADVCTDAGMLNSIMKFFKNLAQVAIITTTSSDLKDSAKDISNTCSVFSDVIKAFSLGKGLKDIFENGAKENLEGTALHQRNLGIAGGVFTTVIAGASIASRCDKFNLIDLASVSEALGTTAVLPFSVFVSGLEIVNNLISIAKASINIHETTKTAEKIKARRDAFKEGQGNIADFLATQVTKMEEKQATCLDKINVLHDQVEATSAAAELAQVSHNQIATSIEQLQVPELGAFEKLTKRIFLTFDRAKAHAELFEKKKAHDEKFKEYANLRAKFQARVVKYDTWKVLQQQFTDPNYVLAEDPNGPLNKLIADKQTKWGIQLENCSMQNIKDGLVIFISTLATVALVATIVFNFLPGLALVSGVMITMTTVWLTISVLGLASGALRKFHKSLEVPKTDFTKYQIAALAA